MHDVAVDDGAGDVLDVDAVVRPAVAFIALDQRASPIAVDLDAVMTVAIANLVVQELRSVVGPEVVLGKHELVMVARVTISGIMDIGVLHHNAGGSG